MPFGTVSLGKLCQIASKRTARRYTESTTLCNRCSSIRLRLEEGLPASDELVFLGFVKEILERKGCPLCRLVAECLVGRPSIGGDLDRQCLLNPRVTEEETFGLYVGSRLVSWIRIECPIGVFKGLSSRPSPINGLASHVLKKKVADSSTIDEKKIQSWLRECEEQHEQCIKHGAHMGNGATKDMLLVDVVEEKLVDGNQDSRYVALSYVWGGWGGSQVALGSTANLLPRKVAGFRSPAIRLPTVLRDAMKLTRSIGERYLWCDAVCVLQDDNKRQIAQMNLIYSRALLTIVALSGHHGDEPLPGLQSGSRQPIMNLTESAGSIRFISRVPSLSHLATHSVYNTRAWTFQEELLSRRCLFLTDNMMFFHCPTKCFREDDETLGPQTQASGQTMLYSRIPNLATMLRDKDTFTVYTRLVADYTTRHLTNSSDILYAFAGITQVLEGRFGKRLLLGLPTSDFNEAILWTPKDRIQQRSVPSDHLASWSWAANVGPICHHWPMPMDPDEEERSGYVLKDFVSSFVFFQTTSFQVMQPPEGKLEYRQDGKESQRAGFETFLAQYVHFVVIIFFNCLKNSLGLPEAAEAGLLTPHFDTRSTTDQQAPSIELEESLTHRAYTCATAMLPFPSEPSLSELRVTYQICTGHDPRRDACLKRFDFWPFRCSNEQQNTASEGPRGHASLAWPFAYVPSISTLQQRLYYNFPDWKVVFYGLWRWAEVLPFHPKHIASGQLYRNTFSSSSFFTTKDGAVQCDVTTLNFTTEPGVTPGQEIQPATVLCNKEGLPCGIAVDREHDIKERITGRTCFLLYLSSCWLDKVEVWHNYMVVAVARSDVVNRQREIVNVERIAIARLVPNMPGQRKEDRTLRYLQIV